MRRTEYIKLLFEGGLIVFSVLFALFIDRVAEGYRTREQKHVALTRIHKELSDNETLIQEMIIRHQLIVDNLNRAIATADDTIRRQVARDGYVDYRLLANGKSLYPRYPASTSWEAAKSSGIISEFDYQVIEACTDVYNTQQMIVTGTLPKILEDLFAVEGTDVKRKLIKLRVEFEEIRSEEQTLLARLKVANRQTTP